MLDEVHPASSLDQRLTNLSESAMEEFRDRHSDLHDAAKGPGVDFVAVSSLVENFWGDVVWRSTEGSEKDFHLNVSTRL